MWKLSSTPLNAWMKGDTTRAILKNLELNENEDNILKFMK